MATLYGLQKDVTNLERHAKQRTSERSAVSEDNAGQRAI